MSFFSADEEANFFINFGGNLFAIQSRLFVLNPRRSFDNARGTSLIEFDIYPKLTVYRPTPGGIDRERETCWKRVFRNEDRDVQGKRDIEAAGAAE